MYYIGSYSRDTVDTLKCLGGTEGGTIEATNDSKYSLTSLTDGDSISASDKENRRVTTCTPPPPPPQRNV